MILKIERFSASKGYGSPASTTLELRGGEQVVPFVTGQEVVVLSREEFNILYDNSRNGTGRLHTLRYKGAE